MDKETLNKLMHEAAEKTIENFAFAEVYTIDSAKPYPKSAFQAEMKVKEPAAGDFCLVSSKELLSMIAENLFALPADQIPENKMQDLLAELLNTIAGRFLNDALPDDTSFTLDLPKRCPPAPPAASPSLLPWHFTIEDMPFSVYLSGEISAYLTSS